MNIIVQKFGGTSVADTSKLYNACKHIIKKYDNNKKVVVVVSAQGKMTDKLIKEENEISEKIFTREHDVLVSTGEQISVAKLVMCLNNLGYNAISFLAWQIPIITDSNYSNAKIKYINVKKINEELEKGNIVVIPGFQGIDELGNITTLGRGGSDTTAVALAAALNAEKCEIYTDVDGVYTADPNKIKEAKKIETISYDAMLEMSNSGSQVLHNRCIEIGKEYNIPINVKSSFEEDSKGSLVF